MSEEINNLDLSAAINERLAAVIDPGAGLDVVRMGLVRDLAVSDTGEAAFTFRPSSPVCPMAFSLAPVIKRAIESVPGINKVLVRVENFKRARELEELLDESTGGA